MHQILRNNALDISLYNSLPCTVDHGLYGSTSCSHSLNYSKVALTTLIPNLVMAVELWEHLKNDANHVHRTTYPEQGNSYRNVIKLQI